VREYNLEIIMITCCGVPPLYYFRKGSLAVWLEPAFMATMTPAAESLCCVLYDHGPAFPAVVAYTG
jgi:hypothetical protein